MAEKPGSGVWIAVIVAIAVAGLALATRPTRKGDPEPDPAGSCKRLVEGLIHAVQAHDDHLGTYPPSGNRGLVEALSRKKPDGAPYFAFALDAEGRVIDPWGRPLLYVNNVDGSAPAGWPRFEPYAVYSTGPDGRDDQGKGDDVASWK